MNNLTSVFTASQIAHWRRYEKVRKGGRFNMLDPHAKRSTGLDREAYLFTINNYAALKAAAEVTKS